MGSIQLDGFSFNHGDASEPVDANGVSWTATDVKGIRGAPATRLAHTDRPGAIGSFRGDAFQGTRAIMLQGVIAAPNKSLLRMSEELLSAVCSDPTRLYPLRYTDEYAVRYMYVERSSEVETPPRTHFTSSFSFSLVAADPRKFGDWVTSTAPTPNAGSGGIVSTAGGGIISTAGGGIPAGVSPSYPLMTVTNPGTAPGMLVPEFIGPSSNPMFLDVATNRSVTFRGNLAAGESLWVNLSPQYAHEVPGMPVGSYLEGGTSYGASGYYGGGSLTINNGEYPDLPPRSIASYIFVNGQGRVHARPSYW